MNYGDSLLNTLIVLFVVNGTLTKNRYPRLPASCYPEGESPCTDVLLGDVAWMDKISVILGKDLKPKKRGPKVMGQGDN